MKYKLFIILFFVLCLIPVVGLLIFGPAQPAANEVLPGLPALTDGQGTFDRNVLTDFSNYLEKRFAFRQELVTANHSLHTTLLGTSPEEDVILGKDGWLFYGETLDDYEGVGGMTERELWSAAHTLSLIQEYCESRGAAFLFTVAPNKNSLYGQYMPGRYPEGAQRNIDLLRPLMAAEGIHYTDLFAPLSEENTLLYRQLDSHWTQEGAGLAGDILLSALGQESKPFFGGETSVVSQDIGDLYEILYPTGTRPDRDTVYTRPFTFEYTAPIRSVDDNFIRTRQAGQSGSLLMFRDSFGNALHLFMAEGFGQATFCRLTPYDLSLISSEGADTVVIELVERNLRWLISRPAVFPAPARVLDRVPAHEADLGFTATAEACEEMPGYSKLTGEISSAGMDRTSPIYLSFDGNIYEATPTGDRSFTAYVPESVLSSPVSVLITCNDQITESSKINLT